MIITTRSPARSVLNPGNNEKYDSAPLRVVAAALFVIGFGMAYWFWPADMDSSGAAFYALGAVMVAIASGVVSVLLWE